MKKPLTIDGPQWRRVQGPDFRELVQVPGMIEVPKMDGKMYMVPFGKGKGPDQEYREVCFRGDLGTYWFKDL